MLLRLDAPGLTVARVAARVAPGGHDLAQPVIRCRFAAGWRNFHQNDRPLADWWVLYDNSGNRACGTAYDYGTKALASTVQREFTREGAIKGD